MGITAYDGLVNWDLSWSVVKGGIRPGVAENWSADAANRTVWTFKLRQRVTFHDGAAFDANAVVWNLHKLLKQRASQFDSAQAAQAGTFVANIESYAVVDSSTVAIATRQPDANLAYKLASFFISNPQRWKELGGDWTCVALHPSSTGPW
jgi:peptide/nickel transport system substrate-binding protein